MIFYSIKNESFEWDWQVQPIMFHGIHYGTSSTPKKIKPILPHIKPMKPSIDMTYFGKEEPTVERGLKQLYFILWTMGENFLHTKSFTNADLQRHENYIRQAYKDGRLLMAALFENGSGFITLVEAETEYEIHKFVRSNPEVAEKEFRQGSKAVSLCSGKVFNKIIYFLIHSCTCMVSKTSQSDFLSSIFINP